MMLNNEVRMIYILLLILSKQPSLQEKIDKNEDTSVIDDWTDVVQYYLLPW